MGIYKLKGWFLGGAILLIFLDVFVQGFPVEKNWKSFFLLKGNFSYIGKGKFQLSRIDEVKRNGDIFYLFDKNLGKFLVFNLKRNQVIKEMRNKEFTEISKKLENQKSTQFPVKLNILASKLYIKYRDMELKIPVGENVKLVGEDCLVEKSRKVYKFYFLQISKIKETYLNFLIKNKKWQKVLDFAHQENVPLAKNLELRIKEKLVRNNISRKRNILYKKYNLENTNFGKKIFQKEKEYYKTFKFYSIIASFIFLFLSLIVYFSLKFQKKE